MIAPVNKLIYIANSGLYCFNNIIIINAINPIPTILIISINISFAFFLPPMVSMAGLAGALMFRKNQISKIFFICAAAFILFLMVMISIVDSLGISTEDVRNNFAWFWYTVQSVVTVLLGLYCWIRTKKLQL